MQVYSDEMHKLFDGLGIESNLYQERKPVRVQTQVRRLTRQERQRVEEVSTERGYRRFEAERRGV